MHKICIFILYVWCDFCNIYTHCTFTFSSLIFSQRLQEINSMLRTGETPTKKRSMALEEEQQSPAKRLCQDSCNVLLRRLQDVANDRNNSH